MKQNNSESMSALTITPAKGGSALERVVSSIDKNIESSIGKVITDDLKSSAKVKKSSNSFFDISGSIANLLAKKPLLKNLSKEKKSKMVLKVLKKEEKSLLRYLNKYASKSNFSASKLEKFAEKLRHIKSLIDAIVQKTITNIELLYRKYVLKISDTNAESA